MQIRYLNFPSVILDNECSYFDLLIGVLFSVDEYCQLDIVYGINDIKFRLIPSTSKYFKPVLDEIISLNKWLKLYINMGKSMKASCVISFSIDRKNIGKM